MGEMQYHSVEELKALRVQVDACIQAIQFEKATHKEEPRDHNLYSMAAYQVNVKLREAKMWLGKMIEGLGSELPEQFRDKAN